MENKYPIDITGYRFGKLLVLERDRSHELEEKEKYGAIKNLWFKCECDCGNVYSVRKGNLLNGSTTSCGCGMAKDLTNQVFGRLTVLKRSERGKDKKRVYWDCKCNCGNPNIISIFSGSLLKGVTQSCGCYNSEKMKERNKTEGLLGRQIGELTVIEELHKQNKKGYYLWKCICSCGKEIEVPATLLSTEKVLSCGHLTCSNGEYKIMTILNNAGIDYIYDKGYFADLKNSNGNLLRYDFILLKNNEPYRLIEYDGEQHFKQIDWHGSKNHHRASLEQVQENDKIKNKYALEHNLPLVRIPYKEYKNITYDLIFNNDNFLIKEGILDNG